MSNSHTHVEGETRETCRVCTPGTDRVELTDAEREALLFGFGIRFHENADHTRFAQGVAAVESIVAARLNQVTELAAEMENPNTEHGTMPGVRMQVRREWAARIRDLASSPEAGQ